MQRKKSQKKSLSNAISEIKELAIEFKAQNGNSSLRIPDKHFNLWIVQKLLEQDGRIGSVETKQKMILWFVPVSIALVGLGLIL